MNENQKGGCNIIEKKDLCPESFEAILNIRIYM
jgi:hypothetical protein